MLSLNSIRYMSREVIKDNPQEPLTVLELRDFLNRLIAGRCGDFKIATPKGPTHYTLNGHNNTVTID